MRPVVRVHPGPPFVLRSTESTLKTEYIYFVYKQVNNENEIENNTDAFLDLTALPQGRKHRIPQKRNTRVFQESRGF